MKHIRNTKTYLNCSLCIHFFLCTYNTMESIAVLSERFTCHSKYSNTLRSSSSPSSDKAVSCFVTIHHSPAVFYSFREQLSPMWHMICGTENWLHKAQYNWKKHRYEHQFYHQNLRNKKTT